MQSKFPKMPFVVSIILLVVFAVGFFYLFKEINSNNKKSENAERTWQQETLRRDGIKELNRSVRMIEAQKKEIETHFAKSSDIVPFLDTVERLAKRAGAQGEVTSVEILKDSGGLLVGIKASGGFEGLYKFLTLLENSAYELEFVGMDMHKQDGQNESGGWVANFKIKLLSFVI